jgi:hypothetical protein
MAQEHSKDSLDVPLEDEQLLAELDLLTRLILAANGTDKPLCQTAIDRLLLTNSDH